MQSVRCSPVQQQQQQQQQQQVAHDGSSRCASSSAINPSVRYQRRPSQTRSALQSAPIRQTTTKLSTIATPSGSGGGTLPAVSESSRSSMSTVDSQGRVGASSFRQIPRRWTSLETAGRCLLAFSIGFLVAGVVMTAVGFGLGGYVVVVDGELGLIDVGSTTVDARLLTLQIGGPVCLATTTVMWAIGAAFSHLWKVELQRRQQAMELRARVQLHALAMDLMNEPSLSPRVLQDPVLRRQLLLKLRNQSAMDVSPVGTLSTRRSSRIVSVDASSSATVAPPRVTDTVISAILREQSTALGTTQRAAARRKSRDMTSSSSHGGATFGIESLLPMTSSTIGGGAFELPGIHISRIETVEYDEDGGGRRSVGSRTGVKPTRRYIIIESDFSSGDFSQLSFTSEHSLTGNGSRSSRSRSSRESSNVSSRLWDFSPRDSEWDADVSHGSRESQLGNSIPASKVDWCGGPSYGCCGMVIDPVGPSGAGGGRDYSLLSRCRKSSTVTFDVGEPGIRRHSSPTPSSSATTAATTTSGTASTTAFGARRRLSVVTAGDADRIADLRNPPTAFHRVRGAFSTASGAGQSLSGRRSSFGVGSISDGVTRSADDFRFHSATFRKRGSNGDQSLISLRIDEDDGYSYDDRLMEEEEEEQEEDTSKVHQTSSNKVYGDSATGTTLPSSSGTVSERVDIDTDLKSSDCCSQTSATLDVKQNKQPTAVWDKQQLPPHGRHRFLKTCANHTDDSDIERRVAKLFYEIEFSATDVSADQNSPADCCEATRLTTTAASVRRAFIDDSNVQRSTEVETQTSFEDELDNHLPAVSLMALSSMKTAAAVFQTSLESSGSPTYRGIASVTSATTTDESCQYSAPGPTGCGSITTTSSSSAADIDSALTSDVTRLHIIDHQHNITNHHSNIANHHFDIIDHHHNITNHHSNIIDHHTDAGTSLSISSSSASSNRATNRKFRFLPSLRGTFSATSSDQQRSVRPSIPLSTLPQSPRPTGTAFKARRLFANLGIHN